MKIKFWGNYNEVIKVSRVCALKWEQWGAASMENGRKTNVAVVLDTVSIGPRPFRLTRAIARANVSTSANLSARAICRTHEKSYSAEKSCS